MYASHGLKKFALTYIDEDGDRITIGSDAEFKEGLKKKYKIFFDLNEN